MIAVSPEGGRNPGGWVIEIVVVPTASGSKSVSSCPSAPMKTSGLIVMAPTDGSDDTTSTEALAPPRTSGIESPPFRAVWTAVDTQGHGLEIYGSGGCGWSLRACERPSRSAGSSVTG